MIFYSDAKKHKNANKREKKFFQLKKENKFFTEHQIKLDFSQNYSMALAAPTLVARRRLFVWTKRFWALQERGESFWREMNERKKGLKKL